MRTSIIATASFLGLLAPALAFAQDPQPAPALQPASVAHPEPLICHYFYHEGALIRRPDCRTQREWDRIRYETQQELIDFQVRSLMKHP